MNGTSPVFDTDPSRTFGCSSSRECIVWTPYAIDGFSTVAFAVVADNIDESEPFFPDSISDSASAAAEFDFIFANSYSYAVWTLAGSADRGPWPDPTPTPSPQTATIREPDTHALLALGLAGLTLLRGKPRLSKRCTASSCSSLSD